MFYSFGDFHPDLHRYNQWRARLVPSGIFHVGIWGWVMNVLDLVREAIIRGQSVGLRPHDVALTLMDDNGVQTYTLIQCAKILAADYMCPQMKEES